MVNNSEKKIIIDKIIKDGNILKGEHYKKLLKYIVDCSIKGYIPNEINIAEEVFGRKDFDPSEDTMVRVYIYKLRKKLDEYYKNEGKSEKIQIQIPKGHYKVDFLSKRDINKNIFKYVFQNKRSIIYISSILILCIIIITQWLHLQSLKHQYESTKSIGFENTLWSSFLKSELPTTIVVGNTFIFTEFREDIHSLRIVHDENIHNQAEFENFLNQNDLISKNYHLASWEVVAKSSLINILKIQPIFSSNKKFINIKTSDQITWQDVRTSNIIYIGHIESLSILKKAFPVAHFKFFAGFNTDMKGIERKLRIFNDDIDSVYTFIDPELTRNNFVRDYVILSKAPGPLNNVIFFIISFHHIGRLEIIRLLTDKELYKEIENKITANVTDGTMPEHFEVVFEISGYDETALVTDVKHFHKLPAQFILRE
jgi:hypothetical protein